jgi:hypothetical protein
LLVTALVLPATSARRAFRLDIAGAVLLAAASACLVFLTSWGGTKYDWGSWQILGLGAGLAVTVAGFVIAERYAPEPIIPLHLFKDLTFTLSALIAIAAGFGMFGAIAFLPTFLQMVDNVSATASGLLMLPLMGGLLVASIVSGQIVSATGRYKVFLLMGTAIGALGMGLLSLMSATSTQFENGIYMAVTGVGLGLVMSVMVTSVQNAAPRADLGAATSTNNFFRQIGASVGTSVVGAIFTTRLTSALPSGAALHIPSANSITPAMVHSLPAALQAAFVHAYAAALPPIFLYLVPLFAAAFVLAWFVKEIPLRGGSQPVVEVAPAATRPALPVVTITAADPAAARRVAEGVAAQLNVPLLDVAAGPSALTGALERMLHENEAARKTVVGLVTRLAAGDGEREDLHRALYDVATSSGAVILDHAEARYPESLNVRVA